MQSESLFLFIFRDELQLRPFSRVVMAHQTVAEWNEDSTLTWLCDPDEFDKCVGGDEALEEPGTADENVVCVVRDWGRVLLVDEVTKRSLKRGG